MSFYTISKVDGKQAIVETKSDGRIVTTRPNYEQAKTLIRLLKRGAGFRGYTPQFFCDWESYDGRIF